MDNNQNKIIIASTNDSIRETLRTILDNRFAESIIITTESIQNAFWYAVDIMPSIVIIDSTEIDENTISYMNRMEEILYNCKLIFLYSYEPEIYIIELTKRIKAVIGENLISTIHINNVSHILPKIISNNIGNTRKRMNNVNS